MWGWGRKTEWGLDLLYSKLTGPPDGHPAALHIFRLPDFFWFTLP